VRGAFDPAAYVLWADVPLGDLLEGFSRQMQWRSQGAEGGAPPKGLICQNFCG